MTKETSKHITNIIQANQEIKNKPNRPNRSKLEFPMPPLN